MNTYSTILCFILLSIPSIRSLIKENLISSTPESWLMKSGFYRDFQRLGPGVVYRKDLFPYINSIDYIRRPNVSDFLNSDFHMKYTENGSFDVSLDVATGKSGLPMNNETTIQSRGLNPSVINAKCLAHLKQLISGISISELWALTAVDSWGKPGPSLLEGRFNLVGNYRQCRSVRVQERNGTLDGFKGNYCVMKIKINRLQFNLAPFRPESTIIQLGSCYPDTCLEQEINLLLQTGLELLNLSSSLVVLGTECKTDEREITNATIASLILASIIGVAMVLGSIYELFYALYLEKKLRKGNDGASPVDDDNEETIKEGERERTRETCKKSMSSQLQEKLNRMKSKESHVNIGSSLETDPLLNNASHYKENVCEDQNMKPNVVCKVLLAFSVITNGSKILSTQKSQDTLSAISGLRFLSMTWVILGHTYTYGYEKFANAATEFPMLLRRWPTDAISNSFVSVDTFFALSGLLVAYLTLKELNLKGWRINWGLYYFHRFWRLTPSYMLVLLFVLGLQRFMGYGALWDTVQPNDQSACEKNWWTNLLYVNNVVNKYDKCFGHSWYLANDMQFFLLSPLMLIPLHLNLFYGLGVCFFFLIGQWVCTAVLSVHFDWPTVMIGLNDHIQEMSNHWMKNYYIVPWCRIGPYVVGILTGYVLAKNNGKVSLNKYMVSLGWTAAVTTGLLVVYGLHGDTGGEHVSSVGVAALYNAVARSAWGACICWVVVACVSGYGGPVNTVLSWSPFLPLGRLTYMVYLIHPCLIKVYYGNHEVPFHLNDTNLVISYLGILFFTYVTSFILNLALESPMIALEKILFN